MEEKLIEKVREYEVLYNPASPEYRNQDMRQLAWEEIGNELQIPPEEAKECWDKLRRCFCNCNARSRRRVERSGRQVAKKKPVWKYEEQMSFLLQFSSDKRKTHNRSNDTKSSAKLSTKTEDLSDEYEAQQDEETDPLDESKYDIEGGNECDSLTNEVAENQPSTVDNTETTKIPLNTVGRIRKKRNRSNISQDLRKLRHEQNSTGAPSKNSILESLDYTDMFFLSMSRMTKRLAKTEQAQIKLALSNSVLSAELRANDPQSFSATNSIKSESDVIQQQSGYASNSSES